MRAGPLDRTDFAQTALVTALSVGALALLGFVLAYWTWAWLGPRAEARMQYAQAPGMRMAATQGAERLFGGVRVDRSASAPAGTVIRLLGVVAAKGTQSGYAVLRLDGNQTVVIREGDEVEPGIRLVEIHADHVVLARAGMREALAWPEQGRTAAAPAPPVAR